MTWICNISIMVDTDATDLDLMAAIDGMAESLGGNVDGLIGVHVLEVFEIVGFLKDSEMKNASIQFEFAERDLLDKWRNEMLEPLLGEFNNTYNPSAMAFATVMRKTSTNQGAGPLLPPINN